MQNLGGKIFGYEVAQVRRVGAAYTGADYSAAADFKKEGEDKSSLGLGGTFTLAEIVKLRGGWRLKDEFGGITFGLGLELGIFAFDYAYLSYGDLGATHKAGVTLAFGARAPRPEKPKEAEAPKPEAPPEAQKPVVEKAVVNSAPELLWTGEGNYASAALSPGTGNTGTVFMYRVKYADPDGDAPAAGYPKVYITRGGGKYQAARSPWNIFPEAIKPARFTRIPAVGRRQYFLFLRPEIHAALPPPERPPCVRAYGSPG